jgi:hypothetical protein
MRNIIAALCLSVAALLGSAGVSLGAEAKSESCQGLLEFEKEVNKSLPRKIDQATRLIQVKVNCATKTVVYVKQVTVDVELWNAGWEERQQKGHTNLHCNKEGLASTGNWNAIDTVLDKDYQYLITLTTLPEDC